METKKRKKTAAVVATVMAVVLALTGTFAWQSISQTAMNETTGEVNPGGRLHDDFDGRNKDVYVENFTDKDNGGVPIFARVRLDEYMEIGEGAGLKTGDDGFDTKKATSLVEGASIDDETTWKTHIPSQEEPFHGEYWNWKLGGSTVYMPTFNKNKDSLSADINGTYEGTTADDDIHYDDYHQYQAGEEKTADAVYDADDNSVDEGENGVEGVNITKKEETHNAKNTDSATVMTMAEWIAAGSKPGSYWVYDTDGWAYWAEAIEPGEATGLLLDGISLNKEPADNWYYAVNVVGQFATMGDWGSQDSNDGFFGANAGAAPTDNALFLLNQAAGRELTVKVTTEDAAATVSTGEELQFSAKVAAGDAAHTNQKVSWTVSDNKSSATKIDATGKLTVGADEYIGGTVTVQALSAVDNQTSGTYSVKITSPWDDQGIGDIAPGSLQTVTIDGADWYVLARDGNKVLMLPKDVLEKSRKFDSSSPKWETSEMRTYLNGEWLNAKTTIKAHVSETTINTRTNYNGDTFTETNDKVFLLSEADVFGTQNSKTAEVKDYTLGKEGVIVPDSMRIAQYNGSTNGWWLRSPRNSTNGVAVVGTTGSLDSGYYDGTYGVRPALWINLAS